MNEVVNNEKVVPFWKIIYKRLLLIILIAVFCALVGLGYSLMFVKPTYTAQTSLILKLQIGKDTSGKETQNTAAITSLYFPSVEEIITSSRAVKAMNEKDALKEGERVSASSIGMEYNDTSMIFTLSYKDYNTESAKKKLEIVIETATEILSEDHIIQAKGVELVPLQKDSSVSVYNGFASSIVIGGALGVVIGVCLAFLLYFVDNTIKEKSELEELVDAPVLSCIRNF